MAAQPMPRPQSNQRYQMARRPNKRLYSDQQPGAPVQTQVQPQPQAPQSPDQGPTFQPVNYPAPPRNPIGYNDTRDVYDMFQNERGEAQGRGDAYQQQFGDRAQNMQSFEGGYSNLVPKLYEDIWKGQGGYTPQQQDEIRQSKGLNDLEYNPQDAQSNYLTGDEKTKIEGSPYGAFDLWKGSVPGLEGTAQDTANMQRGGVRDMTRRYDAATGNPDLQYDPSSGEEQRGLAGDAASRMRAISGDKGLSLDPEYVRQASMTDDEVQQTSDLAAQAAGATYDRQRDDLDSSMRAAGVTNPFGVAAARQDLNTRSVADRADAAARARMTARGQQRTAAQNVEDTRLGAGRYRSGLQMDAEGNIVNTGLGVARDIEGNRIGAARDISGRQMSAAGDIGHTGIGVEGDIGGRNIGVREYNTNLGTGLYNRGEENSSTRAQSEAANRQNVNFTNQGNKFDRGYQLNNTRSGRGLTIANQNQGQSAEGRAAAMGQQGYFGGQYNQAAGNELDAWGKQMQGTGQASRGYAGWGDEQNQVGFGSNFERGLGGAIGSGIGKIFTGGHASGGDFDPYGEDDADRDDPNYTTGTQDQGMTVLSPEGSYDLSARTTVLPTNPNRQTSPDGRPNRFYQMGKDLMPKFKDLAYGPAEKTKQIRGVGEDLKNVFTGGGFHPDSYADGGAYHGPIRTYGSGGSSYADGGHFDPNADGHFGCQYPDAFAEEAERIAFLQPPDREDSDPRGTPADPFDARLRRYIRQMQLDPGARARTHEPEHGPYHGPQNAFASGGHFGGGGHAPRAHAHVQSTPAAVIQPGNRISSISEEGPEILLSKRRPYRSGMGGR